MRGLRNRWHVMRVVFGLLAAVFCSIPDIRTPLGVPIEASLREDQRNQLVSIPLGALLREAEEREDTLEDAPLTGRRLAFGLTDSQSIGHGATNASVAIHSCGSYFPTGPPAA